MKEIGKQFRQAFMVEETKRDIYTKVTGIESRVEKDGKRLIEMEKYKLDLVELRDSIYNKQTNTLDYNRWCATVDPSDHVPITDVCLQAAAERDPARALLLPQHGERGAPVPAEGHPGIQQGGSHFYC